MGRRIWMSRSADHIRNIQKYIVIVVMGKSGPEPVVMINTSSSLWITLCYWLLFWKQYVAVYRSQETTKRVERGTRRQGDFRFPLCILAGKRRYVICVAQLIHVAGPGLAVSASPQPAFRDAIQASTPRPAGRPAWRLQSVGNVFHCESTMPLLHAQEGRLQRQCRSASLESSPLNCSISVTCLASRYALVATEPVLSMQFLAPLMRA